MDDYTHELSLGSFSRIAGSLIIDDCRYKAVQADNLIGRFREGQGIGRTDRRMGRQMLKIMFR